MEDKVDRLNVKRGTDTTQTILNDLIGAAPNMEQIYVVTKDRDGNFHKSVCGDLGGLTFAILMLQEHALKGLADQPE